MTWIDTSCTLPTAERPLRVAEFDDLFRTALRGVNRLAPGAVRLELDPSAESFARDLVARESACCSSFTFTFSTEDAALLLRVEVPPAQVAVLDGLAARAAAWTS
ncbi:hypothetical protein EV643_13725 [Kribbella sp. VKM Ac-2527]|uniref:Arsenate reductase n=1 Tax=Kribbella caucasensis TaxID=2512215 RepID=A0A4V3C5N8_9ACTN|nr:hypothetical protein [Kribbella sp. VKM Ac-2527]TDO30598.1 hypothetical protein EV643_13725 [Kribbella sp. VKM Ac-2527]